MNTEFNELKQEIHNMGNLYLPNYNKPFTLRTDASNTGLGAVLYQEGQGGELRPIEWASKKLTPTETRYGITEKEMLAIYWALNKFEYELRGRRFKSETDHKALIEIRKKPQFANNRINRWIELIHEFDFEVVYVKGESIEKASQLSRVNEKEKKKSEKGNQIRAGRLEKHRIEEKGKSFWIFGSGEKKEILKETEREKVIKQTHENILHRDIEYVYHETKKKFYWPNIKKQIENVIKRCEICQKFNKKNNYKGEFVTSTRPFEKVALDLIDMRKEGCYIIVGINYYYYTRFIVTKITANKTSGAICNVVKEWCEFEYIPETIITDNGKEFIAKNSKTCVYHSIYNII